VSIPSSIQALSLLSPELRFNGVDLLVTFTFFSSGELLERSFKRVLVSERPTKHSNPVFATPALTFSPEPTALLDQEVTLQGLAPDSSAESYDFYVDSRLTEQKERLLIAWFSSQGEFRFASTEPGDTNLLKPLPENPARPFVLVAVLRDERGGVALIQENR